MKRKSLYFKELLTGAVTIKLKLSTDISCYSLLVLFKSFVNCMFLVLRPYKRYIVIFILTNNHCVPTS